MACFGLLKTMYYYAVAETGIPTLSALASKQRFITTYKDARNRCLNSSDIEAGFEATSISLVQLSRVLNKLL